MCNAEERCTRGPYEASRCCGVDGASSHAAGMGRVSSRVVAHATSSARPATIAPRLTRPSLSEALVLRLPRLDLPRDRLRLQEEAEVVAAARLRIGARHVEAGERMD